MSDLEKKVRSLEIDLHNRARDLENKLRVLTIALEDALDRLEVVELEIQIIRGKMKS